MRYTAKSHPWFLTAALLVAGIGFGIGCNYQSEDGTGVTGGAGGSGATGYQGATGGVAGTALETGGVGGVTGGVGGTAGVTGGVGGVTGGVGGTAGVTGGVGGDPDCLAPDTQANGGYAGGACDPPYSMCDFDEESLPYRHCGFLMGARRSVYDEVMNCFRGDPDICTGDVATKVQACTDSAFEQACLAPGADVDGQPQDCASIHADCPEVSQAQCDTLMSVLTESFRQEAYECYFGDDGGESCRAAFDECIGLPGELRGQN